MTSVKDVLDFIEQLAPSYMKESWDRVGLNCGHLDRPVEKILVALDPFKALYTAMMLNDTLNTHLEEVDCSATEMYDRLTSQLAEQEGITEQLKATNQMEWVQQMNNIRSRAAEVVWKELICV